MCRSIQKAQSLCNKCNARRFQCHQFTDEHGAHRQYRSSCVTDNELLYSFPWKRVNSTGLSSPPELMPKEYKEGSRSSVRGATPATISWSWDYSQFVKIEVDFSMSNVSGLLSLPTPLGYENKYSRHRATQICSDAGGNAFALPN